MELEEQFYKNLTNREDVLSKNKKLLINLPFGVGLKYLINKQFSLAIEFEIKKTFYDKIDYLSGANTKNINNITGLDFNNSQKTINMEAVITMTFIISQELV